MSVSAPRRKPLRIVLHRAVSLAFALRERFLPRPRRFALIIAHMRSGSSLLDHLLLQHPLVAGAGERNAAYRDAGDLTRLVTDAYVAQRRLARRAAIFVDQVNHDRFLETAFLERGHPGSPLLPTRDALRPIFLIRQPQPAIASMVDVLGQHYGFTLAQAIDYYQARLQSLGDLVSELPRERCLWIAFEDLVTTPEPILRGLEHYLDLPMPALTPTYPTHRFTGGAGDPSEVIRRGTVTPRPARTLDLPAQDAQRLENVYAATRHLLEDRCLSAARE